MAAIDPQANDLYWYNDQPAEGMNRTAIDESNDIYWFNDQSFLFLFPATATNTSLFFMFFAEF